jgi:Fur family transcriptional regulator, ferric uptake regulator
MPTPNPRAGEGPAALIAAHGGRITRTRLAVLEILQASTHSLSHDAIAARLTAVDVPHDRVTLYRTLDWLVEQGLAHRISGPDRTWHFNRGGEKGGRHAHFHCDRCGHVLCLESVRADEHFDLPAGYRPERAELVFHGTCPDCGRPRGDAA